MRQMACSPFRFQFARVLGGTYLRLLLDWVHASFKSKLTCLRTPDTNRYIMKRAKFRLNRQVILILALFAIFIFHSEITNAQKHLDCIYAKKSNILNPDTLKLGSDKYKIFWHFVKYTNKEIKDYPPLEVKAEFKKLGITLKDDSRFSKAYIFFDTSLKNHKKSCENIASFKDLAP